MDDREVEANNNSSQTLAAKNKPTKSNVKLQKSLSASLLNSPKYSRVQKKKRAELSSIISKIKSKELTTAPKGRLQKGLESKQIETTVSEAESSSEVPDPAKSKEAGETSANRPPIEIVVEDSYFSSDDEAVASSNSSRRERIEYFKFSEEMERKTPRSLDALFSVTDDGGESGAGSSLSVLGKVRSKHSSPIDDGTKIDSMLAILDEKKTKKRSSVKRKAGPSSSLMPVGSTSHLQQRRESDHTQPTSKNKPTLKRAKTTGSLESEKSDFFSFVRNTRKAKK